MRKKIIGFALCTMLSALCVPARAQQPVKIPRIGYVSTNDDSKNPGPFLEAFRRGLREVGYNEGENILVEYRFAEGNRKRIPEIVAELVQLKVDVLDAPVSPAIRAAKQATKTIPIVMVVSTDPVAAGFVESLARPGANITGLSLLTRDLSGKRLELFREAVPRLSIVGVLRDAEGPTSATAFKDYEAAARALRIPLQSLEVRGPNPDLEGAFQAAANGHISAIITMTNLVLSRSEKRIADLAAKNRLPSMFEASHYVDAGGLMSYAGNDAESYRRAAVFVDKILKGAKPADLPVEQPMKFEFVINLKTAKQIGITILPTVLARADRVIR